MKDFFIWKIPINFFLMNYLCLSIFSWSNIYFTTTNSKLGIINLAIAVIIKIL